jgi:hypothetical protein
MLYFHLMKEGEEKEKGNLKKRERNHCGRRRFPQG